MIKQQEIDSYFFKESSEIETIPECLSHSSLKKEMHLYKEQSTCEFGLRTLNNVIFPIKVMGKSNTKGNKNKRMFEFWVFKESVLLVRKNMLGSNMKELKFLRHC